MTERQILMREYREAFRKYSESEFEEPYDEENDMDGFELKMSEYEVFGIED